MIYFDSTRFPGLDLGASRSEFMEAIMLGMAEYKRDDEVGAYGFRRSGSTLVWKHSGGRTCAHILYDNVLSHKCVFRGMCVWRETQHECSR